MKKHIWLFAMLVFVYLAIPVGASLPLVVDEADLLTAEEERELEDWLGEQSDVAGGDLVVLTVDSLEGSTAQTYADDYFDYMGYGRGDRWSGALFLVAMDERQWAISTCGTVFDAMTDAALDELEDTVIPYLSDGEYADAFRVYGALVGQYCTYAGKGEDYSYNGTGGDTYYGDDIYYYENTAAFGPEWLVLSPIIGCLIALIPMGILKGQLTSVKMQTGAADYQRSGVHITGSRDLFLYRNVSKKPIPKDPPRSSGGGGHISSSGRSHGGRSGGF